MRGSVAGCARGFAVGRERGGLRDRHGHARGFAVGGWASPLAMRAPPPAASEERAEAGDEDEGMQACSERR